MKEDGIDVGRLQLHSLFIPGSHNAGAYNKFTSYTGEYGFQKMWNLKWNVSDDTVLLRYSVNQGEDIWTQLLFGMRYLDLRVCFLFEYLVTCTAQVSYYEDTPEKFWLVHDFVKQNPLWASPFMAKFELAAQVRGSSCSEKVSEVDPGASDHGLP